MTGRSVAVIGAGPSGLCAAKELLQEGHSVWCFERTDSLGGVFKYRSEPESVGVWESLKLTSSALVTSFSDFFPDWRSAKPLKHCHLTHGEYLEYLRRYAEHFGVLGRIRFQCEVRELSPLEDGGWLVTVADKQCAAPQTRRFDAVAVCSGLHKVPYTPNLPGLQSYRGQILHAAHYKKPASIQGTSAVFVGAGESGGEIIAEASKRLNRSYVSLRRGVFVIPRLVNGLPNDYTGTRLLYSLPEFALRRSDPQAQSLRAWLGSTFLPLRLGRMVLLRLQRRIKRLTAGGNGLAWRRRVTLNETLGPEKAAAVLAGECAFTARVERLINDLREQAGGNQFETFATKTEAFVQAIAEGRCEIRPAITSVTSRGVVFADGSRTDVDAIVFCTGYEPASVPFMKVPVDLTRLYRNCFTPAYRETLAFLGFLRPPLGAIPPMAEMQARWFAQVLSGNSRLPNWEEMEADIDRRQEKRNVYFNKVLQRLPHLVDYSTYMDDVAELIDCKPRALDLVRRPLLLYKIYTTAFSGVQFRLRGPHAQPEMAERILLHVPSHAMIVRFFDLALAKMASCVGLTRFRPRLSLTGARGPSSADYIE